MLFNTLLLSITLLGLNYLSLVDASPRNVLDYAQPHLSYTIAPESIPTGIATIFTHAGQPPRPEETTTFSAGLYTNTGEPPSFPTFEGPAPSFTNQPKRLNQRQVGGADGAPFPYHPQRTRTMTPGMFESIGTLPSFQDIYHGPPTPTATADTGPSTAAAARRAASTNDTTSSLTGYIEIATFYSCPDLDSAYPYWRAVIPPEEGCYSVGWGPEFLFHGVSGLEGLWLCNGLTCGNSQTGDPNNVCVWWTVAEIGLFFCAPSGLPGDGVIRSVWVDQSG